MFKSFIFLLILCCLYLLLGESHTSAELHYLYLSMKCHSIFSIAFICTFSILLYFDVFLIKRLFKEANYAITIAFRQFIFNIIILYLGIILLTLLMLFNELSLVSCLCLDLKKHIHLLLNWNYSTGFLFFLGFVEITCYILTWQNLKLVNTFLHS